MPTPDEKRPVDKCPTCFAPSPEMQPAVVIGGTLLSCSDEWHDREQDRAIAELIDEPYCPDCFHFWDVHDVEVDGCARCRCTEIGPPASGSRDGKR